MTKWSWSDGRSQKKWSSNTLIYIYIYIFLKSKQTKILQSAIFCKYTWFFGRWMVIWKVGSFFPNWAIFNGHHLLQNRRHRCKDRWRFDLLPISLTTFAKAANKYHSVWWRRWRGVAPTKNIGNNWLFWSDPKNARYFFFIHVSKFYFTFFPKQGINFPDIKGERNDKNLILG